MVHCGTPNLIVIELLKGLVSSASGENDLREFDKNVYKFSKTLFSKSQVAVQTPHFNMMKIN